NGLLFLTAPEATPWVPEFDANDSELAWFLDGFLFAPGRLSREDQMSLLFMVFLQQFFPPLRRTRVVPAFLGPQGSGKTSAIRRLGHLLLGPRFEVTGLERGDRGEAAFVAAVTNSPVCGLDNADSRIPWV